MRTFRHKKAALAIMAALSLAFAGGCSQSEETIFIISTNDMHGAIENMPRLATLVNEYRAQDTASVFLVDAGDRWTGNPYVDLAVENGEPADGKPIIDLMNKLGYDVATFGNHEFDKGMALLDKRTAEAKFKAILANIETGDTPLTQPAPYAILTSGGGTRLAILGLITNSANGHPEGNDYIYAGTVFPSPVETAYKYAWLKDDNDVLVALTHTGDDVDSIMAAGSTIFDLIVGGHTHRLIDEPLVVNGTLITQTGGRLRYAGITEIRMRGRNIKSISNKLVKLDTIAPDGAYMAMVEKYYDNPVLKEPAGSITGPATQYGTANMLTDISRKTMKTDFAFYHIGGVRVPSLNAGTITLGDLFAIDPFASRIVRVRMTLPQIRAMIINKFNDTRNPKESHRPDLFPSGMRYTVITDERGEAVEVEISSGSVTLNDNTLYNVALSDYVYNNYNFEKPDAEENSPLVTDILKKHFNSYSPLLTDNTFRIEIREREKAD